MAKKLLVMGPGASVNEQADKIGAYIKEEKPLVISINYIPEKFHPQYLFLTNARRYLQMSSSLTATENADIRVAATSNVTRTDGNFPLVLNYSNLIDETQEFPDNSMMMLIRLLIKAGVKKMWRWQVLTAIRRMMSTTLIQTWVQLYQRKG